MGRQAVSSWAYSFLIVCSLAIVGCPNRKNEAAVEKWNARVQEAIDMVQMHARSFETVEPIHREFECLLRALELSKGTVVRDPVIAFAHIAIRPDVNEAVFVVQWICDRPEAQSLLIRAEESGDSVELEISDHWQEVNSADASFTAVFTSDMRIDLDSDMWRDIKLLLDREACKVTLQANGREISESYPLLVINMEDYSPEGGANASSP